ncbi:MAG TPA: FKBP-type peptidyl-prolyl cis-trans isomerase [Cyclobacteriaceae bacterium]|nr:FKBP-type peptidyl-prolyl cis-trans isomerase [Cyclobacteriaceae bacterium]
MKRSLTLGAVIFISSLPLFAQSKKELEAEVKKLQAETKKLQAEIEELKKPKVVELNTANKKAGYGMGVLFANNIKGQGGDSLDVEAMLAAVKDVYEKKTLQIDQQSCLPIVQQFMQQAAEKKGAIAKEQGRAFLESNKKNEGVKITASGLQYKVLTAGTGKTPTSADKVTVHYAGKLIDGTEFDSSIKRGQPAIFGVTQVIGGWTEALQLMKEGDKWMLYIPYELAYGERGQGGQIPPYATLVFEVELIKVN